MSGYADVRWDFRKPGLVAEMSGLPSILLQKSKIEQP
jgi:hypothetical protein